MKMYNEKGQAATLELMLMMMALATCMLGVLFIGAITISNNERLMESKFEAEKNSRNINHSDVENDPEFSHWQGNAHVQSYLKELFGIRSNLDLPFGLDYTANRTSANTLEKLTFSVNNPGDSRTQSHYFWEESNQYNNRFTSSMLTVTDNAFNAAQLVSGHKQSELEYSTTEFLRGADKRRYEHVEKSMRNTAHEWLGITVNDDDIRRNPSNKVFMPWIKPNQKLME